MFKVIKPFFSFDGLIRFIRRESDLPLRKALIIATVAGLSNALILAIVNSAAEHAEESEYRPLYAIAFVVVLLLYIIAQRWILVEVAKQVEGIIHRVRMRIVALVRDCEFIEIEAVGRATIYNNIARHTQTLSQSATNLTVSLQMGILVLFTGAYLGYVSMISLISMLISLIVILTIYFRKAYSVRKDLMASLEMDNQVQYAIEDLLNGLREAKLSQLKTRALLARIDQISDTSAIARSKTQVLMGKNFVFSQSAFYVLLGIMVFVVPQFTSTYGDVVQKSTTAVLFLIGPISGVVGAIPVFENASAAAGSIMHLERTLTDMRHDNGTHHEDSEEHTPPAVDQDPPAFEKLELQDLHFGFGQTSTRDNAVPESSLEPAQQDDDERGFMVGPINLTVRRGDRLFITGGNGSGKSTLLHLLLGLYPAQSGAIMVDGEQIHAAELQSYREMFSAIFDNFHLSKYLDGVQPAALKDAAYWLNQLEIQHKVKIEDGKFTTIELSAGQRKRLGLIGAILEKRPILVLDEWAADQDPVFRKKFYRTILPELTSLGFTIIAVTHDNAFFDVATQRIHMDYGVVTDTDLETLDG